MKLISLAYYSLDDLDFPARMCLADTIQHGAFCADVANRIIKGKKVSVEDFSLVTRMGDNLMDKLLQSVPLTRIKSFCFSLNGLTHGLKTMV